MTERTCIVEGCERKHEARGLCHNHYQREHHVEHLAARKATQAAYRAQHREVIRQRSADWRAANPARAQASSRATYAKDPAVALEQRRRYRAANPDKIRALNVKRKALLRGVAVVDLTAEQWTAIKAASGQRCHYCGTQPRALTIDHVAPLSRGGQHTASNVVPACGPCNSSKGDRPAPAPRPSMT